MLALFVSPFATLCSCFRTRAALQLEILALRHQDQRAAEIAAWACSPEGSRPVVLDVAYAPWVGWRSVLAMVKPETVVAWHSQGIPAVLDLEESPRTTWKAGIGEEDS